MQHDETFAESLSIGVAPGGCRLISPSLTVLDYAPFLVLAFHLDELEAL